MQAEANIVHPARILICGKSGSGKTHLAMKIVKDVLNSQIDRWIIICPTFATQKVFRYFNVLKKFDAERDVFEDLNASTFNEVYRQLLEQIKYCEEKGIEPIRTCLLIDDCGSNNQLHGGRISPFGKLCIQFRHLNTSAIVIVQNPKLVSPNYRENANHFIFFPSHRFEEKEWIYKELNPSGECSKITFFALLEKAWYNDEINHFLYVFCPPRSGIKMYRDFSFELNIKRKPLIIEELKSLL